MFLFFAPWEILHCTALFCGNMFRNFYPLNLIYFMFSNVAASNGGLNELCLEGHEGERFWPNLRYYCGMFLDGIRKIMTNLSRYMFSGRRFEFENWLIRIKGRWPEKREQNLPHCLWVRRYASMHVYICKLWIASWINTCVEEKFNTPIFCHIYSA